MFSILNKPADWLKEILQGTRAGHFRYFEFIIINQFFGIFFIKLITYFCTSPI